MNRSPRPAYAFAAILIGLLLIAPVISFFLNAFAFRWFYPQLIPHEWSLQAWVRLLGSGSEVINALGTSLELGIGVTVLALIIGLPAAKVLGQRKFRYKRLVEFVIFAPTFVPGISYALGINVNFIRWGLAGTLWGVGLVHLVPVLPYVVLILSGVFSNYDSAHEEQARTLGAVWQQIFWFVTLPAIFPGLVVASLLGFLVSWNQYLLTFLIGGGSVITMPVLLFSTLAGGNNSVIAALSLLYIAPAILILLLTSRFLSGTPSSITGAVDQP